MVSWVNAEACNNNNNDNDNDNDNDNSSSSNFLKKQESLLCWLPEVWVSHY
jgi:hypothetical protein